MALLKRTCAAADHHARFDRQRDCVGSSPALDQRLLPLAIAPSGLELNIDDFDRISAKVPLLADLKPSGRFVATDMYKAGGARLIAKRLKDAGILKSSAPTVTGKTIGEEADALNEPRGQEVVRPLSNPMSPNGGLAILRGNLAPEGAVVKIAGKKC